MKALEISAAIVKAHSPPKWLVALELRLGSGYGWHERRIDAWALDCAPGRGNRALSFEIKVSKADYRRDLAHPEKQRGAVNYSNEFYYVAPVGLIDPDTLPAWAGLMEVTELEMHGRKSLQLRKTVAAPVREKFRPSWPFVVSLMRRIASVEASAFVEQHAAQRFIDEIQES